MWDLIVSVPDHCLSFSCISELLWLCRMVALKSLSVHSFNDLIITILGVVCNHFSIFLSLDTFRYCFEGRMWDLIVSLLDHCLPFYFGRGGYKTMLKLQSKYATISFLCNHLVLYLTTSVSNNLDYLQFFFFLKERICF